VVDAKDTVTAFSQARASTPSLVDFDLRHEVILLCSSAERGEAGALAETLLALGFDALVLSGTPPEIAAGLEGHGQGARPALLVATDANTVEPVLRSRLARVLSRPYCWLEGAPGGDARELLHRISARLDAFEREHATETSHEDVVVDEVSNVILLPVAPTLAPTPPVAARPQVKRPSRAQFILWPLAGAALAAAGFWAAGGANSEAVIPAPVPPPASGPAVISPPAAGEVEDAEPTPLAAAAAPAAVVQPAAAAPVAVVLPAAVASAPVSPAAAPVQRDPLADVLNNERVIATDDLFVYEAPARARDWYEAMNVCRGRSHAGMDGWATPSSKQLHALARARVLPEGSLWSRTRALRSQDVAFVVHGRAGTVRRAIKTETIDSAVCVRRRSPSP